MTYDHEVAHVGRLALTSSRWVPEMEVAQHALNDLVLLWGTDRRYDLHGLAAGGAQDFRGSLWR